MLITAIVALAVLLVDSRTELLRLLFIVPNLANTGIFHYQGRPCGDPVALPTRRP
jgi:hypothetical protein